jgi:hypothetical protein
MRFQIWYSKQTLQFYGTEIEIWAGFGPVDRREKMGQLWMESKNILAGYISM